MNDLQMTSGNYELLVHTARIHSQVFDIQCAVNPLVAAAAPLLTIATQLREQQQSPDSSLHQALCQEIKIFENKARSYSYRSPFVLAARYFLCALIDEVILNTTWGKDSVWKSQHL